MKQYVPDYYEEFACKMGACRHTCCAGWEIDVDPETMGWYMEQEGALGEKLRANIDAENGCFRLGEGERCPFLRKDGLCELIIRLGEDGLCGICREHPRYYNDYSDRTEAGLGLCCEAAAELILTRREKARLVLWEDDGEEETPEAAEEALRARRKLFLDIAQDRTLPFAKRLERLREEARYTPVEGAEWKKLLLSLERLDEGWTERLIGMGKAGASLGEEWSLPLEQLMCSLILRHVTNAEEADAQLDFALHMQETVMAMLAAEEKPDMATLIEICRQFSGEIEYSDENIGLIRDFLRAAREQKI